MAAAAGRCNHNSNNSRYHHLPCLMKSCFHSSSTVATAAVAVGNNTHPSRAVSIASLPDDLLLECLSRVHHSALPSLSLVCRRWSHLLLSPSFSLLRRRRRLLRNTLFAVSFSQPRRLLAAYHHHDDAAESWRIAFLPVHDDAVLKSFAHSRAVVVAIDRRIYFIGFNAMLRFDAWTGAIAQLPPPLFSRKKFAAAAASGKIYVAGGGATAVEEFDPEKNEWRGVSDAPRKRHGCFGAAVEGVFYLIGGLIQAAGSSHTLSRATDLGSLSCATSMDLYDAERGAWLRSRTVPCGGCVAAACAAGRHVYVLAIHVVDISFWRFNALRNGSSFGEWRRIRSPPLPVQVRAVFSGGVRFRLVGVSEEMVALVQARGCIDDLLRSCGRSERGVREGLVLVYDAAADVWRRGADLPEVVRRAAFVCVEC